VFTKCCVWEVPRIFNIVFCLFLDFVRERETHTHTHTQGKVQQNRRDLQPLESLVSAEIYI